ncbi:MAG: endo-1,4-beta-xylanase, partial [Planctomycetota bacterium]
MAFTAKRDFAVGEGQVAFHVAQTPQRIAIGGTSVTNYGDSRTIDELPSVKRSYPGMEADAPWRTEAARRIDELRKGDLTIQVVDTDGNPLPNATVEVEMTRHAFNFGTAIAKPMILGDSEDAVKYRALLLENFNYATGENFMKPPAWEAEGGREEGLRTIAWLNDHDLKVRGHNLIWPSFTQSYFFPDYIADGFRDRLTVDEAHAKEWMRAQIR